MSKSTVARAKRHRDELVRLLKLLDDATLDDLERRGRYLPIPDGMPAGGAGGGRGSEVSRPTEQAATARVLLAPPADPIARLITGIFARLGEASTALAPLEHSLQVVRGYGATAERRESSLQGDCLCCQRPVAGSDIDRLKAGFCPACYTAWLRARNERPDLDRGRFILERRQALADREAATAPRHAGDPTPAFTCDHSCCAELVAKGFIADTSHPHEHWHPPELCPACHANGAAS